MTLGDPSAIILSHICGARGGARLPFALPVRGKHNNGKGERNGASKKPGERES